MTALGHSLTNPENGWRRYDDASPEITYTNRNTYSGEQFYDRSVSQGVGMSVKFQFHGTKLRLIGIITTSDYTTTGKVFIDGTLVATFSQIGPAYIAQALNAEVLNLSNTMHDVVISADEGYLLIDAIDIDETGELPPPLLENMKLTATQQNSQIQLSWTPLANATSYNIQRSTTAGGPYIILASNLSINQYVDTSALNGKTYYYLITAIKSSQNIGKSNEASISLESKMLLRILMSDSSEKEYRLTNTETISFINWYNRPLGSGNSCYIFTDSVDSSTEYVSFERIISFKTMALQQ